MTKTTSKTNELDLYKNSILKVYVEGNQYNYNSPWSGPISSTWNGSGFIINFEDKPCIITNAHVVADSSLLEVRRADKDTKYLAKVLNVDHDCDLAMLTVDNPNFWKGVKPLELGDMPTLQDKLKVIGFPMGGDELCITKGTVSRNEVGLYAHSGVELLHTQVTAEINPGNSGGPAVFENKVLGVAFQGILSGNGLGYIIPANILKHFITDTLSPGPYKGFPNLAFTFETMENPYMKEAYGLKKEESGVRIKAVDRLESCVDLIKPDDVLLTIDGQKIKNDGTVKTSFSNRIKFTHLIREKSIGDSITFDVLREGKRIKVEVPLLNRSQTTKLAQREWDKAPTYYIHSGIVFAPVTYYNKKHSQYRTKSKKLPCDQKLMIHSILSSEHTRGLNKKNEEIIEFVNDVKVRNMVELIATLEAHEGSNHKITTKGGSVFIFKKLSKEENDKILESQLIAKDRSRDQLGEASYKPGCPEYTYFTPQYNRMKSNTLLKEKNEQIEKNVLTPLLK